MRLHFILLLSHDPAASTEFYRRLFGCAPRIETSDGDYYVEFRFGATTLAIRGLDPALLESYGMESNPSSRGWGAFFVFSVDNFDQVYARARAARLDVLDGDMERRGHRFFSVRDPAGYTLEISEENYGNAPL